MRSCPRESAADSSEITQNGPAARPRASPGDHLDHPIRGVVLRLHRGRGALDPPAPATPTRVTFDFTVRVGKPQADGTPTFLRPCTQGPPAARFVYVNAGRQAGQADTPWDRRAKVPLAGITQEQVRAVLATPGKRLAVTFTGQWSDGGPRCATVRLPPQAWHVIDADA